MFVKAAGSGATDVNFLPLLRSEVVVGSRMAPAVELLPSLGGLRGLGRCSRTVVVKQGGREEGEGRLLSLGGLAVLILMAYTQVVPLLEHRWQGEAPSHCRRGRKERREVSLWTCRKPRRRLAARKNGRLTLIFEARQHWQDWCRQNQRKGRRRQIWLLWLCSLFKKKKRRGCGIVELLFTHLESS